MDPVRTRLWLAAVPEPGAERRGADRGRGNRPGWADIWVMATQQYRPPPADISAHMILEAVPAPHPDELTDTQSPTRHHATMPGPGPSPTLSYPVSLRESLQPICAWPTGEGSKDDQNWKICA